MIFQFPDIETFRFAVTSAQVPVEVSGAPAEVAFDPAGRPSVKSADHIPTKPMQRALRKLGVKEASAHYSQAIRSVSCWPQVLAVTKQSANIEVTPNTPVLFELPATELQTLVAEMLRLGNDRQSFRALAPANGHGERVLLKVIGPPYYTLLRAIDKTTQKGATVTAFVEKAPRVWVEIGYQHPLADKIRPAAGQAILLRPDHEWMTIEDGAFQDVYEVLDLKLPAAPVEWQQSQLKGKLAVPLRLAPGNAADAAELWVLTENAVDQLDILVRDADERLLARLLFAVAGEGDRTTIVIKTRPSKLSPPVVSLEKAIGFKPFWKLPNLFLPIGRRLMPTLRRDAVRKLLADDPAQVVWLMPTADGKFRPEVLPDEAFRPLEDWIDYVIDREHESLHAWMQATRFDFDSFICRDEVGDRPKDPLADKGRKPKRQQDSKQTPHGPIAASKTEQQTPTPTTKKSDFEVDSVASQSKLNLSLRALEDEFKAMTGALDAPERLALWPELARLNAALKDPAEAALCWTNAYWEFPEVPSDEAWAWLRSEDTDAHKLATTKEWDATLANKLPSPSDVRALAARVIHSCRLSHVPESLLTRLPKVREYIEAHEGMLGVRTVWLTWWHLARAAGGQTDVLGLARVRDRLLQRLLAEGLNKERDLPYFLRTTGDQNGERNRQVRERALRVHRLVDDWHAKEGKGSKEKYDRPALEVNRPFVDFLFAFGMARLGDITAARDLVRSANSRLVTPKRSTDERQSALAFLHQALEWRIENAVQGKPHIGPLPTAMMAALDRIDEGKGPEGVNPRYVVDRMRHDLWVLEPQEKQDPYADKRKAGGGFYKSVAELAAIRDKRQLAQAIHTLILATPSPDGRLIVYTSGLGFAARLTEEATIALLEQVPHALDESTSITGPSEYTARQGELQHKLFERALFLAGHYDRLDLVQVLFAHFLDYLRSRKGSDLYEAVSEVARECLRSLRKVGMKNEISQFLQQIQDLLFQNESLSQRRLTANRQWPELLISLLALAEGWLYFGGHVQAEPILEAARETLFENANAPTDRPTDFKRATNVVQAYVSALCQGPVDEALTRMEELFRRLQRLPNSLTTGPYYSLLHLKIVDEVIRSLVSDNLTLGDQARRWLDDDEYLVRRRIHGDMKRLLDQNGF